MDVDMIKSSASTALDLPHHHHHHHLDMITIMMQMEKPTTTTSPDHHQQLCNPNYQATTLAPLNNSSVPSFLDLDNFSGSPVFRNPNPNSSSSSLSSSFMGLMNGASPNVRNSISGVSSYEKRSGSMAAMREMIFRIAAMQPIHIDPEAIKPPKRRNVRISKDPQSVAARHRRERISERIRILQRLVPGGTKMDTASMLDEAIHYVKFLKKQVQTLEQAGATGGGVVGFPAPGSPGFLKAANCQPNSMIGNPPMAVESMRMLR